MTESVWEYPRPPRVEATPKRVEIVLGGQVVASSTRAVRVLETSHPPTYYLPADDFAAGALQPSDGSSWCEWKGRAAYHDLVAGEVRVERVAWSYPKPSPGYVSLQDMVAVYPGRVDRCTVDGETVRPQPGGFYGGWITDAVTGPFKGGPDTTGW